MKRPTDIELVEAAGWLEHDARQLRWQAETAEQRDMTLAKHLRRSAENLDKVAAWLDGLRQAGWQERIEVECQSFVDEGEP